MESMFRGIRNARRVGFARSFPPTLDTLERQGDYRIDTRFIRSEDPDRNKKDSVTNARIIGPIGGRCLALIFFNLPEPSGM